MTVSKKMGSKEVADWAQLLNNVKKVNIVG
jgi:hypothetical protein